MRFHWQNLNEKKGGKTGLGIRNGRAWWHLTDRTSLNFEWGIRPRAVLNLSAQSGGLGDYHLQFHVSLLGIYLFVSLTAPALTRLYNWASKRDGFEIGVRFWWERTLQLSIDVASRVVSWRSKDPRWLKGWRIDFADLVFGRAKYAREVLSTVKVVIPMPEGSYPGTVELNVARWKRPRWPLPMVRYGSTVEIPGGIPFAGKGENSWDCGDDGLWSISSASETVEEAIATTVASVLKSRKRNGTASFLVGKPPVLAHPIAV